jgi:hypothetical protein
MLHKFCLALVVASLTTGSLLAQVGGNKVVKNPSNNKIGTKGPKNSALFADGSDKGLKIDGIDGESNYALKSHVATKATSVSPGNSQKGIIAVLIGQAKAPGTAPSAKSAVPGPVPLKEQMKGRMRNRLKNGKN